MGLNSGFDFNCRMLADGLKTISESQRIDYVRTASKSKSQRIDYVRTASKSKSQRTGYVRTVSVDTSEKGKEKVFASIQEMMEKSKQNKEVEEATLFLLPKSKRN